jgi:hypothetical protein
MGATGSRLSREQLLGINLVATAAVIGATVLARRHLFKKTIETSELANSAPPAQVDDTPSARVGVQPAAEPEQALPPAKQQPEPPPPSFRVHYTKEKGRHVIADRGEKCA